MKKYKTLQKQLLLDNKIPIIGKSKTIQGQISERKKLLKTCMYRMEHPKGSEVVPRASLALAKAHMDILYRLWVIKSKFC